MLYFFIDFLVGWGATSAVQNFGEPTTKAQLLNLIRSIRTVAKSKYKFKCIPMKIIANYLIINRPNIFFSSTNLPEYCSHSDKADFGITPHLEC